MAMIFASINYDQLLSTFKDRWNKTGKECWKEKLPAIESCLKINTIHAIQDYKNKY